MSNSNQSQLAEQEQNQQQLSLRRELEQEVAAQDIIQTMNKYEHGSTDNCSAVHSFTEFILKSALSHSSKAFRGV